MNRMQKPLTALAGAFVGVLALSSTGCGKLSGLVTDVRYQAYSDTQGNPMTKVEFDLDTGALMFPSLAIPIVNPNNPSQIYGMVVMSDILGGGTQLSIDANLAAIAGSVSSWDGCRLPNGKPVPMRMPAGVPCPIGIPLGGNGSVLYLAFTDTIAMVGTAVVINEFDGVGGAILGADVFLPFGSATSVNGIAGLFTSLSPGQSGVGIFADLSAVIPQGARGLGQRVEGLSVGKPSKAAKVAFVQSNPSSKTMKNAQKALKKLEGKRLNSH